MWHSEREGRLGFGTEGFEKARYVTTRFHFSHCFAQAAESLVGTVVEEKRAKESPSSPRPSAHSPDTMAVRTWLWRQRTSRLTHIDWPSTFSPNQLPQPNSHLRRRHSR